MTDKKTSELSHATTPLVGTEKLYADSGSADVYVTPDDLKSYANLSFTYFATGTDASHLTGTVGSARIAGTYSGITGTGTLTAGGIGTGFDAIANSALANSQITINGTPVPLGGSITVSVGGGTPGGLDTQFQINNGGVFGGIPVTWNGTDNVVNFALGAGANANFQINYNAAAMVSIPHKNSIHVQGSDNAHTVLYIDSFGSPGGIAARSIINLRASRGTAASPTASQLGDEIARVAGRGYGGTGGFTGSVAGISVNAAVNFTTTDQASFLGFRTTASGTTGGGSDNIPPLVGAFSPAGGLIVGPSFFNYTSGSQINSGASAPAGVVNAATGYQINSAAASGNVLRGDGTNFISAQLALADLSGVGSAASVNTGTAAGTIPLNNGGFTQSGTANFTGTFQIGGNAITWPAAAMSVARIDAAQTFVLASATFETIQLSGATGTNNSIQIGVGTGAVSESISLYNDTSLNGSLRARNNSGANNSFNNIPNLFSLFNNSLTGGFVIGSASGPIYFAYGGTAFTNQNMQLGTGVMIGDHTWGGTDAGAGCLSIQNGVGIGAAVLTTAFAAFAAGTTAKAAANFASGAAPTSPNNGDFWFDGTNFKARVGGTTKTFTIT